MNGTIKEIVERLRKTYDFASVSDLTLSVLADDLLKERKAAIAVARHYLKGQNDILKAKLEKITQIPFMDTYRVGDKIILLDSGFEQLSSMHSRREAAVALGVLTVCSVMPISVSKSAEGQCLMLKELGKQTVFNYDVRRATEEDLK